MREKEKTTVPIPSVGADGEQSLSYVTEEIVAQEPDYFNFDDGKHGEEYLKQMLRMSEPSYLPTMTMNQIYETVYESRRPIIENLLYPGAYLFVGAPKVLLVLSAPDANGVYFFLWDGQTRQIIISVQFIPKTVAVIVDVFFHIANLHVLFELDSTEWL